MFRSAAVVEHILDALGDGGQHGVVEGEKGLFVSLPSRRNVKGEWVEHCFPMTKELRAKLSAAVLEAYEAAVQNEAAAVS